MKSVIAAMSAAVVLTACGGGGGDSVPVPAPAPTPTLQEGLYMGSSLNFWDLTGMPTSVLVLEQQEVWVLDGLNQPSIFSQGSFAYSDKGTASNGSPADVFRQNKSLGAINSIVLGEIPMELRRFGSDKTSLSIYTAKTSYTPGARLLTSASGAFDYNKPADIQVLSGAWGSRIENSATSYMSWVKAQDKTLTLDSNGALSTPVQSSGCSVAGAIKPRPSGKNVFNLKLTLTGCTEAGEYSGVAFNYMDAIDWAGSGPYVIPTIRLIAINQDKTRVFSMTSQRGVKQ